MIFLTVTYFHLISISFAITEKHLQFISVCSNLSLFTTFCMVHSHVTFPVEWAPLQLHLYSKANTTSINSKIQRYPQNWLQHLKTL